MKLNQEITLIIRIARYLLFLSFFCFSIRTLVVTLTGIQPSFTIIGISVVVIVAISTWLNIQRTLVVFFVAVPIISGLIITGLIPSAYFLSFIFSTIYITWFLKRSFFKQKTVKPKTLIGNLIDIFSGTIFISLLLSCRLLPIDFLLYRMSTFPLSGQNDPLWCIEAGYTILQGLFFYRIIETELDRDRILSVFNSLLVTQSVGIIFFSCYQLFFNRPNKRFGFGVFSPFDDIHSYGSYTVFLVIAFITLFVYQKSYRLRYLIIAVILIFFILLSTSFATVVTMVVIGSLFLLYRYRRTKFIVIGIGGVILLGLLIANIYPPEFKKSDRSLVMRYSEKIILKRAYTKLSGRFKSWDQALGILREYPLSGIGIGRFYSESNKYHLSKTAHPDRTENAHNYYIQLASEVGIPALVIFLLIIYGSYKLGYSTVHQNDKFRNHCSAILFGLSAYLITMLTGHPLLLSNQQFLFWFVIAFITVPFNDANERSKSRLFPKVEFLFVSSLCLLILIGFINTVYPLYGKGTKNKISEFGFYLYEKWQGDLMRWTWRKAKFTTKATSDIFGIKVIANPLNSSDHEGLELMIKLNGKLLDTIHFFKGGIQPLYYYIPSLRNQEVELGFEVDKTFTPSNYGIAGDIRELGIAVSPITFLNIMPKDGLGLYSWESIDSKDIVQWPQDKPFQFRRARMHSSINIENLSEGDVTLLLMCEHPNIEEEPISLEILSEYGTLYRGTVADKKWKKIVLNSDKLKDSKIISFQVDRSWNPRISGISEDTRDIGIAIALPNAM